MYITVAICTWNRASLLDQTLIEMRKLCIPPGVEWELLVVNNNCTDKTDSVLEKHQRLLPLRRIFEPKQGLSNARNRAVDAARGKLLLWTDDDVLVSPHWLEAYVTAAISWPHASFFGGSVTPWFQVAPPGWVLRNLPTLAHCWALIDHGCETRPLGTNEVVHGANMAFQTTRLRQYPFDARLGRVGKGLGGNEEIAILRRMRREGHAGVWVGSASVKHFIPPERLTLTYVWELSRRSGAEDYDPAEFAGCRRIGRAPRFLLRRYVQEALRSRFLSVTKGPRWSRCFIDAARLKGMVDAAREADRSGGVRS